MMENDNTDNAKVKAPVCELKVIEILQLRRTWEVIQIVSYPHFGRY